MSSKKPGHTTCRPANLTVYEIYVAFRLAVSPYIFIRRSNPSWPKQEIRAEKLCAEKVAGIKICTEQEDESWQVIGVEVQIFRLDECFLQFVFEGFVPLSYPTGGLGWTPSPWYLPQFQLSSQVAGHVPKVLKRLQNQQALTQAQRSIAGEEMQKAWLTVFLAALGLFLGVVPLMGLEGLLSQLGRYVGTWWDEVCGCKSKPLSMFLPFGRLKAICVRNNEDRRGSLGSKLDMSVYGIYISRSAPYTI